MQKKKKELQPKRNEFYNFRREMSLFLKMLCETRILTQQLKWITEVISCAAYSEGLWRIILDYGHWPDLLTDCLLLSKSDLWLQPSVVGITESHKQQRAARRNKMSICFLFFLLFFRSHWRWSEWCIQDHEMERSILKKCVEQKLC